MKHTQKEYQKLSSISVEFSAGSKDWKTFEQNNKEITLNVLVVPHNTEIIRVAYRSE